MVVYKRTEEIVMEQHRNVSFENPPRHTLLARVQAMRHIPKSPCTEGGADHREKIKCIMVHTRLTDIRQGNYDRMHLFKPMSNEKIIAVHSAHRRPHRGCFDRRRAQPQHTVLQNYT